MKIYDLHTHSTYSDGQVSVEYLIERAASLGYGIGVSDHLFCEGLETADHIRRYLDAVCPLDILVGGEANIGEEFLLSDELTARFDYLIASVHAVFPADGPLPFNRYFAMRCGFRDSWEGYDRSRTYEYLTLALRQMENHLASYRTDILGHCCVMPFYDDMAYDSTELKDWEKAVVALCRKYGVAMEISGLWHEPYERLLRLAKDAGVKFSFGCDCHTKETACDIGYALDMAKLLELNDGDLFLPKKK